MIETMLDLSRKMKDTNVKIQPNFKVLVMLADEFRKRHLPLSSIGKIKIEVNENFLEVEEEAKKFIENYTACIANVYKEIMEEFGEIDGRKIFEDVVSGMSIKYSF